MSEGQLNSVSRGSACKRNAALYGDSSVNMLMWNIHILAERARDRSVQLSRAVHLHHEASCFRTLLFDMLWGVWVATHFWSNMAAFDFWPLNETTHFIQRHSTQSPMTLVMFSIVKFTFLCPTHSDTPSFTNTEANSMFCNVGMGFLLLLLV